MTAKQLIKVLEKIVGKGDNPPVCVRWDDFRSSCNGVFDVVDVQSFDVDDVRQVDGDGFQQIDSRGVEKHRRCVVLLPWAKG